MDHAGDLDEIDGTGELNKKHAGEVSLYTLNADKPVTEPKPFPPGTLHTASVETVDNDYSPLLHGVNAYS